MIANRPGLTLAFTGHIAERRMRKAMAGLGLKPSHGHVLMLLGGRQAMSQQALLEELGVDPSVLVTILNDLEHEDFAQRRRDPADRRRHIVEISGRGRALLARLAIAIEAVEAELFAAFNDSEVETLHQLLSKIKPTGEDNCAEEP